MDPVRTFGQDLEGEVAPLGHHLPGLVPPLVRLLYEEVTRHGRQYQHVPEPVLPVPVLLQWEVELGLRSGDNVATGYASPVVPLEHVTVLTATTDLPASVPRVPGYGSGEDVHV